MQFTTEEYLRRARLTDDPREMQVVAPDEVRRAIAARGGRLYLWVSCHGCCFGGIALLEAVTERPLGDERFFRRIRAGGFDLYLDAARRFWPQTLELELHGRARKIRAYWNGQAWVG